MAEVWALWVLSRGASSQYLTRGGTSLNQIHVKWNQTDFLCVKYNEKKAWAPLGLETPPEPWTNPLGPTVANKTEILCSLLIWAASINDSKLSILIFRTKLHLKQVVFYIHIHSYLTTCAVHFLLEPLKKSHGRMFLRFFYVFLRF